MPAATGLHHIALTVTDLDASAGWYQHVLGLGEVMREDDDGRRAVLLSWGGPVVVGLVQHDTAPVGFDPTTTGMDHVAFTVATRDELDRWVAHLDAAAVAHSGAIDVPPGAILNFKDPDGIALALFWDR